MSEIQFLPSKLIPSHCFIEFFLFLTSALVFSNISIMSWINGLVYKEIGKVWLWLKVPQGIEGVRNGHSDKLQGQMHRDRCFLEVPVGKSPLRIWD